MPNMRVVKQHPINRYAIYHSVVPCEPIVVREALAGNDGDAQGPHEMAQLFNHSDGIRGNDPPGRMEASCVGGGHDIFDRYSGRGTRMRITLCVSSKQLVDVQLAQSTWTQVPVSHLECCRATSPFISLRKERHRQLERLQFLQRHALSPRTCCCGGNRWGVGGRRRRGRRPIR